MGDTLHLPLTGEYFDQIRARTKLWEYRLATPYWDKRLSLRAYKFITLTRGYPAKDDEEKRITRMYAGYRLETITHPHFGPDPVRVYAIDLR